MALLWCVRGFMHKKLLSLYCLLQVGTCFASADPLYDLSLLKDHNYARGIYYTDQSWFMELLQGVAKSQVNSRRYIHAAFKTFTNVVKGTDAITTDSFIDTIQFLNEFLPPYMQQRHYEVYTEHILDRDAEIHQRLKEFNRAFLLNSFKANYDDFKTSPVIFLHNLADILAQASQEEAEILKLRHMLKLFLELHLGKLLWAVEDGVGCWEQVKTIAYLLTTLFENNVLDDLNDLDDLYWSLIHRFGNFFEHAYRNCSMDLFDIIKQDIAHGSLLLLDLEEHDTCIEKRSECLLHIVMHAEAKKRSYDMQVR
jgi:hypothetical protein